MEAMRRNAFFARIRLTALEHTHELGSLDEEDAGDFRIEADIDLDAT